MNVGLSTDDGRCITRCRYKSERSRKKNDFRLLTSRLLIIFGSVLSNQRRYLDRNRNATKVWKRYFHNLGIYPEWSESIKALRTIKTVETIYCSPLKEYAGNYIISIRRLRYFKLTGNFFKTFRMTFAFTEDYVQNFPNVFFITQQYF